MGMNGMMGGEMGVEAIVDTLIIASGGGHLEKMKAAGIPVDKE